MKYGLMTYAENKRTFNIGDYIQSLAAKQFLPQVDCFINREKLARYTDSEAKLIMNGWFTHNTTSWVPSAYINPLLISFHVNNSAAPNMLSPQGIAFLKSKQPIGCRDHFTVNLLQEKGIEAYFSGCLTLTLDSYQACEAERGEDIYIVDPLYGFPNKQRIFYDVKSLLRSTRSGDVFHMHIKQQYLKKIFTKELLNKAQVIHQELPAKTYSEAQKFIMAETLLHKYARAKLVITSRIHCALPCLALGTPVIYLNGFDSFVDSCRLAGLADLFNRVDVERSTGKISNNFHANGKIGSNANLANPVRYKALKTAMEATCHAFIEA